MGGMVRCTGEVNYFRDYKRLEPFAKLATSYQVSGSAIIRSLQVHDPERIELSVLRVIGNHTRWTMESDRASP
jgi:hypothetical protein